MWKISDSPRINVADFFEAGRLLQLDWAAMRACPRAEISEVALNRPGWLAGFLGITPTAGQVLGLAEMTYLSSLPAVAQRAPAPWATCR